MSIESVKTVDAFSFTVDKTNNTLVSVSFRTLTPEEVNELDHRRAASLNDVEAILNTPASASISQQNLLRCISPVLSGAPNCMSSNRYREVLIYMARMHLIKNQLSPPK